MTVVSLTLSLMGHPLWAGEKLPTRIVVFAPGLGTSGDFYRDQKILSRLFKRRGYRLVIADTATEGSIQERARSLVESVERQIPQGAFHLVAFSMGGLDARLALSQGAFKDRVVSLTTLSTPHRGSPAASWLLERIKSSSFLHISPGLRAALEDLTPEQMNRFNSLHPDPPGVLFFSMGFYLPPGPEALYTLNPIIWAGHRVLKDAGEGRNDGLVSTVSARWGQSLGEYPGDHFSETMNLPFFGRPITPEIFERVIRHLDRLNSAP